MRSGLVAVAMIVCLIGAARADIEPAPDYRCIAASDVIAVGRVLEVDGRLGRLAVDSLLKGTLPSKELEFSPTSDLDCCSTETPTPFCAKGERIVLMVKATDDKWLVLRHESLGVERRAGTLAALNELVPVLSDRDVERRSKRMVGFLLEPNEYLRHVAAEFVAVEMEDKPELGGPSIDGLIAALDSPHKDVRIAALRALRRVQDARLLPKLVAATQRPYAPEAETAWRTLGALDRDEAFEFVRAAAERRDGPSSAITALAASPRVAADDSLRRILASAAQYRLRVLIDGCRSRFAAGRRHPPLIDDLVALLRDGDARLEPDHKVEDALLEAATPEMVEDIVGLLARPALSFVQESSILRFVELWADRGRNGAKLLVLRERQALFTDLLDRGAGRSSRYSTELLREFGTESARECLQRAAKSHPDETTRARAQAELDAFR
jgi:hypothetical protein